MSLILGDGQRYGVDELFLDQTTDEAQTVTELFGVGNVVDGAVLNR